MTDRTTISIDDPLFERLSADKPDGVSWTEYLEALADGENVPREPERTNALTADDVGMLKREIADEIEDRMTRR
ncbi:hypothetical protein [Halopelagius fulvigenes]|uniref:CopG family transcriptional regulator n=1 Tax=Halopelagius fulvigenes TaxID=1198324 RepID=A0ABD5TZR3_9EURY